MQKYNDLNNTDPLFVEPVTQDFTLMPDSPAADNGVTENAPDLDINGNPRVGNIDSGAYKLVISNGNEAFVERFIKL